jgi:pimeloyl-ACP methyl ester carboxylesterase
MVPVLDNSCRDFTVVEQWREIGGVRTFSRTMGQGRDVVLIHGVGVSSNYWRPAQVCLASTGRFRVHALDFPGFGKSADPPWKLTVQRLGEHLDAWIDDAIPGELDLVGQSMGCEFAVVKAVANPDRVRRLVLAAPNGMPDRRSVTTQLLRAVGDALREPLSLYPAILPDYLRCGALRILWMLAQQRDDRTEQLLRRLPQPTLLLRGERDTVAGARRLARVAARIPHVETVTIPGAHGAHFSHPDAFARVVSDFLIR